MAPTKKKKFPENSTVLFADYGAVKFATLRRRLGKEGVQTSFVSDGPKLLKRIQTEMFDIVVVNLLLGGGGTFRFIDRIKKGSKNPKIRVIVLSKQIHKDNIENTIKAGANDFVADPFENENLFNRVAFHLTPQRVIDRPDPAQADFGRSTADFLKLLIESIELLSRLNRKDAHRGFLKIVTEIAKLVESNRTSLMIVDKLHSTGVVLASSDDPKFNNFQVNLSKYPEILHVANRGTIVVVEDTSQHILTREINKEVSDIKIGSIMVFPIYFGGEVVGVLTIRRPHVFQVPDLALLSCLQAIANTAGAHANTESVLRRIYKQYAAAA